MRIEIRVRSWLAEALVEHERTVLHGGICYLNFIFGFVVIVTIKYIVYQNFKYLGLSELM